MRMGSQRGAAVVEFAVVLPILLVILFGIIEFSILFFDKALLTNASREGARVGIVRTSIANPQQRVSDTEIQAVITNYCANSLISFGNDTLQTPTITRSGNNPGDILTVRVDYNFRFLVFSNLITLFGGSYRNGISLRAVTVMRLE